MKQLSLLFIVTILLISCKKELDVTQQQNNLVVTTLTNDTIPSPLYVGGTVSGDTSNIIERGVVYGLSNNLSANSYDVSYGSGIGLGGFYCPSTENGKITSTGGTFSVTIQHLLSGIDYYVRAYVVTCAGDSIYGNVLHIDPRNYRRKVSNFDGANVWWTPEYDLFDLSTDRVITPETDGSYNIYFSSNENPYVYSGTYTPSELPSLLMYKFGTLESCQNWCSNHH